MAAQWGLQHRSLGIDELYWSRRHQYLTLVYQVDAGATLGAYPSRTSPTVTHRFC